MKERNKKQFLLQISIPQESPTHKVQSLTEQPGELQREGLRTYKSTANYSLKLFAEKITCRMVKILSISVTGINHDH